MAEINNETVTAQMNERKNRIAWIVAEAQTDPSIDSSVIEQFFYTYTAEAELYKYSGNISFLKAKMDEQIADNGPFKSFLEFELPNNPGVTVYMYILDRLH